MHGCVCALFAGVNMRVFKVLLASLISMTLLGCGAESDVKEAVRKGLVDPDSAKFGKITIFDQKSKDGKVEQGACVTVNAKNSFGGYVGEKQLYLSKTDDGWLYIMSLDIGHGLCVALNKAKWIG